MFNQHNTLFDTLNNRSDNPFHLIIKSIQQDTAKFNYNEKSKYQKGKSCPKPGTLHY